MDNIIPFPNTRLYNIWLDLYQQGQMPLEDFELSRQEDPQFDNYVKRKIQNG